MDVNPVGHFEDMRHVVRDQHDRQASRPDIEDQFEHLLVEWGHANPMGPANRGDSDDPLIGTHGDARAMFDIPLADEELQQMQDFTRFVTTRGTLYAFFPGIAALHAIAAERRAP